VVQIRNEKVQMKRIDYQELGAVVVCYWEAAPHENGYHLQKCVVWAQCACAEGYSASTFR